MKETGRVHFDSSDDEPMVAILGSDGVWQCIEGKYARLLNSECGRPRSFEEVEESGGELPDELLARPQDSRGDFWGPSAGEPGYAALQHAAKVLHGVAVPDPAPKPKVPEGAVH